jgi:hypothetical protein
MLQIGFDTGSSFDSLFLLQQPGGILLTNFSSETIVLPEPGAYTLLGILDDCSTESVLFEANQFPVAPTPEFMPFIPPLCDGDSLALSLEQSLGYTYTIEELGVSFSDSTLVFVPAEVYTITANNGVCDTLFTLGEQPALLPVPGIQQNEDSLLCDLTSSGLFIWLLDGDPVDTTTVPYYLPTQNGEYQVGAYNEAFCLGFSDPISFMLSNTNTLLSPSISIFPNPARQQLHIEAAVPIAEVIIYNARGQQVFQSTDCTTPIGLHNWPAGPYALRIKLSDQAWVHRRFIKQ